MTGRIKGATTLLFLLLAAAFPGTTRGAEREPARVEIGPYAGYRLGGSFNDELTGERLEIDESPGFGMTIGVNLGEGNQVEFLYSRQPTRVLAGGFLTGSPLFDVDVTYFHVGGVYNWDYGTFRPFIVGSLGATHLDPDGPGFDSEVRFSVGLGGGIKLMANDRVGFRLHGRGYATFVGNNTSVFCSSEGGATECAIRIEGDVVTQFEVGAGLIFAF